MAEYTFKKPTVKRSATDITQVTGFIMGIRKFGKTSLWSDMINERFGTPEKGLLVSCGLEHGTNMIDNINTTHINTYRELDGLKKWLVEEKNKEHNIQMICFDSIEELFSILEQEIIRRSNTENPNRKVKSIKAAYGGFTNGEKECAKLAKSILNDFYNAGIIPWAIGHTKLKNVKDKGSVDEEGFQKLGSTLIADYEAVVADCFDIVVTGLIDRNIEERGSGDNVKRYVKETERRLYFRGNEIVEAGGRMKGLTVPEYIPFDSENMGRTFIQTINNSLKAGRSYNGLEDSPKLDEIKTEPNLGKENIEEVAQDVEFDELDEMIEATEEAQVEITVKDVMTLYKASTNKVAKSNVGKLVKANGYKNLKEADNDTLLEVYKILTEN